MSCIQNKKVTSVKIVLHQLHDKSFIALLDGSLSCQSSSLKTEFTSVRLNSSQCAIDVDDVLTSIKPILEEKWLFIHYGKSIDHPAKSCQDLFKHNPLLPSGKYWLQTTGDDRFEAYCDMEGTNCDDSGGWMRVGYLDMSDQDTECPSGFRPISKYNSKNELVRACGRYTSGCKSVTFSPLISYTQVCGRVTGYQQGSPDAFKNDGISITLIKLM